METVIKAGLDPVHKEYAMKNEKPLSDLYQLYVKGELSKKNLEGQVFLYLCNSYRKYRVFNRNRDRWDEFLDWLYPKLVRAIDRYREQGASFDAYINALVYNAAREYRRKEAEHNITEYACWTARAEEMPVYETEPEYFENSETRKKALVPKGIRPRQILLLLLKSYYFVTDDMIKQTAGITGVKTETLRNMLDEIQKRCSRHEIERQNLAERVHCQYYRCRAYEKRMNAALPGTDYYTKMKDRFERARKRFRTMKRRLERMRVSASNRIISEVAGIPKGTVDSSLFAIKDFLTSADKELN